MRGQAPTIMVSSTFYDLREVRQQLATFLEHDLGYRPLISESPDFPVDPDADAIENCRRRVEQNADALILVVGSRYGFVEQSSGRSVTNLEYLGARAKGIPVYAFIEKRTLTLFEAWRSSSQETRNALGSTVDNAQLFRFVEEVRSSDSVWTFGFESASEITSALRTQLAYQMHAGLEIQRAIRRSPDEELLRSLQGRAFRIAVEKPQAWEYRLFAQVLGDELRELADLRREYDAKLAFGAAEHVRLAELGGWFRLRLAELRRMLSAADQLLNDKLQLALGPPGVAGSAPDLVFVAQRLARVYREAMEWASRVRRVQPEEEDLQEVFDALDAYSRELVVKLGDWGLGMAPLLEREIREALAAAPGSVPRTLNVTLRFDSVGVEQLASAFRGVLARRGIAVD